MIAHVFRSYPAGTGRPLGVYILDLKHENLGERLGDYVRDPEKHKVEWSRTVNTGVDDPRWAITAIEKYNAQNLRAHRVSRWVHIAISFSEGERPTREQMAIIEDRLMAAIGFGDHPRLSAVHKPDGEGVDNWHLHIGVSRIDPTTLKAEHPRHNHFFLQAEAARLEIDLGLRQERKTLLKREREEIEAKRSLDRAVDAHHSRLEQQDATPDLEREMRGYFDALGRRGAEAAEAAGVTREAIMSGLVGIARIRPHGALWEPDAHGTAAFVTPVRVHPGSTAADIESTDPAGAVRTGEIVDLIAWHPSRPDTWVMRTGEAAALGAVQYRLSDEASEATPVHDSPLAWLRAGGAGIVVLTQDPVERRLILDVAGKVEERIPSQKQARTKMAERVEESRTLNQVPPLIEQRAELARSGLDRHGRGIQRGPATPSQALFARYKTEHAIEVGARKQAEQAVYDRWTGYHHEVRSFYEIQHEQQKLAVMRGPERHKEHEILTAGYRGDRIAANRQRAQELARVRRDHPLQSYDQFLKREADRGDREAGRILRQRQEQQRQQGLER